VALGSDVKNALSAASIFLSAEQKQQVGSFLQAPFTGTYSAQSGQVVGILKDMKSTFSSNLEEAIATEKKDKEFHDAFMQTKKEAYTAMEGTYKEKQESLSANDGGLSSKKTQLQVATKDKAEAEEFLTKLTDTCAKKAKDYEDRNLLRANEVAAISQAISILNSDSAFETFGTVSATSTGKTNLIAKTTEVKVHKVKVHKAVSFLQLRRGQSTAVQRELTRVLSVERSSRLMRVLATVEAGNPFTKVLVEIEKMKVLNEEEGKQDKKNLDWCTGETDENDKNLKSRKEDILSLTGAIDKLTATVKDPMKGLTAQIKGTEASLVQNYDAQGSETKQRTEENVAYQADVRNLVDADDLLSKAIVVLTKYYEELEKRMQGESFAQEEPTPPSTWETYKGQSSKGGDAITMLKFIQGEARKEEMQAHADEEKAQAGYEDSMTELKNEQSKLQEALVKLNQDLATAEKDLVTKGEDLKGAKDSQAKIENYLLNIKPGCDFITTNFDLREKNRKTETDALEKAVTLIKETVAYKAAAQNTKEESFGKCRSLCVKDEPGAKCQACLAKVTVPAYCAGHKGTSGC